LAPPAESSEERETSEDIAREVQWSPLTFIRQFHLLYGTTPYQLRIESRLHQAEVLLAMSQHSATEVCMEVGFSSLGSFSDLFVRRVGTSPSAYRRYARTAVIVPGTLSPWLFPGRLSLKGRLPSSAFAIFEKRAFPAIR
jgi:AraC-like DNA-binding protein